MSKQHWKKAVCVLRFINIMTKGTGNKNGCLLVGKKPRGSYSCGACTVVPYKLLRQLLLFLFVLTTAVILIHFDNCCYSYSFWQLLLFLFALTTAVIPIRSDNCCYSYSFWQLLLFLFILTTAVIPIRSDNCCYSYSFWQLLLFVFVLTTAVIPIRSDNCCYSHCFFKWHKVNVTVYNGMLWLPLPVQFVSVQLSK
jgi:hypothetical protein